MTEPEPASPPRARNLASWIGGYLEYTDGLPSPPLFRKWAAISTVGAALERRVWNITVGRPNFANLFVILVGRPGVGKSKAINGIRDLVQATKSDDIYPIVCHLTPVDVTKAALYDWLSSAKVRRSAQDPDAKALGMEGPAHYHSGFLAVSELSDLIREHDTILLSAMNSLYDCLPMVEEERRYRADQPIKILRPQMSLLGGTTPATLTRTFPTSAWDEGFLSRCILIYADEGLEPDLFELEQLDPLLGRELVEDLRVIGALEGEFPWTKDARAAITQWQKSGKEPVPSHPRLGHYNTRRMIHAIKLSLIAAANRRGPQAITVGDFQEALSWLVEAEAMMPGVFMEMMGKSDGQVMNDLYAFVYGLYTSALTKNQPVRKGLLYQHLRYKVNAWQIEGIVSAAVTSEILEEVRLVLADGKVEVRYKPGKRPRLY